MVRNFDFKIADQSFEGFILSKDPATIPNFVYLHGAGNGTKERLFSFSEPLVENGVSILAFDHSGAGKDLENMKHSSLERRTLEAKSAIEQFASKEHLTVCGSSMGGHIALKMLEYFHVKTLILFCPAIYDQAAYTAKFDENFTKIIRKPESWRNSDVLSNLERFTGNLLIIIGANDTVIPSGVIELLDIHSPQAVKKEIMRIPDCPHAIQTWLSEHSEAAQQVSYKILEFIS